MYDPSNPEFGSSENSTDDPGERSSIRQKVKSAPDRTCSYCGEKFVGAESRHLPFCSKRCQQIDLGMWLNESYGMPFEGEGAPERDDLDD